MEIIIMASRRVRIVFAIILCLSFVTLITACGNTTSLATPSASSTPTGGSVTTSAAEPVVAKGKLLYDSHCAACHGQFGEGGNAPDGTITTPLSFHQRAHANLFDSDQQIARSILDGVHEEAGSNRELGDAMPRFRNKLSEAEVTDIISYMKIMP